MRLSTMVKGTALILVGTVVLGLTAQANGKRLPIPNPFTDDSRRTVLLSVVQKDVVHERGKPRVNISYRSSSSEWRQIEYRGLDPWNRNVSVKKGDTVFLEAWQQSANQIDCLITIPGMPGHVSNDTRKSIGTVKCRLTVPQ